MSTGEQPTLTRDRLVQLFSFLKAYTDLRYPPVRDIQKQLGAIWIGDLPKHPNIEIRRDAANSDEEGEDADILLKIVRPTLTQCPPPPPMLGGWLKHGWREFPGTVEILESRNFTGTNGRTILERFQDDARRVTALTAWKQLREAWLQGERPARDCMIVFQRVYEWYGAAEREGERIELILGEGLLRCSAPGEAFNHPVLLQKVELEFDPEKRHPEFVFRKQEHPPELYVEFLRALPGVNVEQLGECIRELKEAEFTPLGAEDTAGFLQRLIQGLFPTAGNIIADERGGASEEPEPSLFSDSSKEPAGPTIERKPVIFMRHRRIGPGNVFDMVLQDIEKRDEFSTALLQMLGLKGSPTPTVGTGNPSESVSTEDEDILLGKAANREQLEIAKQLARRDCVLVQGPPGTGKTHTIANLIGHLLSQGKRVLVTAHTPKALRVLRRQVVEPLQPLCVSVLHNDKQSQEELQASVRKIHIRLSEDPDLLDRDVQRLRAQRKDIIAALRKTRNDLLDARQDEIRDVVFGGRSTRPMDAAKMVKDGQERNDWIPGPVELGASLPLSHAEVVALYQSNARISPSDERDLGAARPSLDGLPAPADFQRAVEELTALETQNLRLREELWSPTEDHHQLEAFDRMLELAGKAIDFLRESTAWQLEAVQAGRDGDHAYKVWMSLVEQIETTWREIQECHVLVMEHGPSIVDHSDTDGLLPLIEEVLDHHEAGRAFGLMTKLTKRSWYTLPEKLRLSSRPLRIEEVEDLKAARALLRIRLLRANLVDRWGRQMEQRGGIPCAELGERPEYVCRQFVGPIKAALAWHRATWVPLEGEFIRLGLHWGSFLDSIPPESGDNAELRRMRRAVLQELAPILKSRNGRIRQQRLLAEMQGWLDTLPVTGEPEALATQVLRQALTEADTLRYKEAYEDLVRLKGLESDLRHRRELLEKLARTAPAWASAVENRVPRHSAPEPLGDPRIAWEWRQLHDELERRAGVSLDLLQQRLEALGQELLETTSRLIEKQTWVYQIRNTGFEQKQALGAYAVMRSRLTKTGKGVRDAMLRAAARREMTVAKDAVPVWIMPLTEVAESFDPRRTKFDVVIIDEASQCDPASLFAVYLGRQTIIVGDDEQVTPLAVGVQGEEVNKLIRSFLQGVPHKELFDGENSVYELAQISFGGVIRLTEHFRCAPSIIAFSNALSYKGEIKPLREASAIPLQPHVVPMRVSDGRVSGDSVNENEAEVVASLICAAIQQPEYAKNERGEAATFGAISMVADRQAVCIDRILRQRLSPTEYHRRQILCGDSAQFQGDERDIMFLSVVDAPPAQPPLPMRQEGPKKMFKKRFNVAASRARNQMWVVHSLNHETDLQSGDYRRRLIEHAIDPNVWERELQERLTKVDPRSKAFEGTVLRRLMERGYDVVPQYQAGAFFIDLVVKGNGRRLAIECDGEQFHGLEQLQDDLARQAVLERLGWTFVRIRGSIFFRDEERAMEPVFKRLEELGIPAELKTQNSPTPPNDNELVERVIREAEALRAQWRAGGEEDTASTDSKASGHADPDGWRRPKDESGSERGFPSGLTPTQKVLTDYITPTFQEPQKLDGSNDDSDAQENSQGDRSEPGQFFVEIDWNSCGVRRSRIRLSEATASATLKRFLEEIAEALGGQALEKLATFRVKRGPLVSRNPTADFANRRNGSTYTNHPIADTGFFVLTHSSSDEKEAAIRGAWRYLNLSAFALSVRRD